MKVHSNLNGESVSTLTFVTPMLSLLKATLLLKSHQAASRPVLAPYFPLFPHALASEQGLTISSLCQEQF